MLEEKNEKMLRNLYNIQKMAFNLDKQNIGIDMIRSFETTARKLDEIDTTEYNAHTISKFDKKDTLEEEQVRLKELVSLIDERVDKRNKLVKEFESATGASLEPLDNIKAEDKVEEYRERYNNINRYLDAKEKINTLETELADLSLSMKDAKKTELINLENNKKYETDLKLKLNGIISRLPFLKDLNDTNSEKYMKEVKAEVKETENGLDAFNVAFNTIKNSGISIEQATRYESDRGEFRKAYYTAKKKLATIKIYEVVTGSVKLNYEEMLFKRDKIRSFIAEITKIRRDFNLTEDNYMSELEVLIDKQYDSIKKQYDNISTIKKLEEKINFKEGKLSEYKQILDEENIKRILIEYNIIKVDNTKEPEVKKEEITFEIPKERPKLKPNTIINVTPLYPGMDILSIRSKTNTVMSRVSKLLGVAPKPKVVREEPIKVEQTPIKEVEPVRTVLPNITNTNVPKVETISPVGPIGPAPEKVEVKPSRPVTSPKTEEVFTPKVTTLPPRENTVPLGDLFEEKPNDIFVNNPSPMPSVPETPAFTPEKPKEDLFFEMPSLPTGTGYTAKPNNLNTSNNAEFELPNFPF